MRGTVVVDASLATMWTIPGKQSPKALDMADRWAKAGTDLLAPSLILAETNNAVYKRVARGEMTIEVALKALEIILGFGIEISEQPGLQVSAMRLAHSLKRPTTYDCQYLALAQSCHCDLWTGDRRFFNSTHRRFPSVKWIGQV
ncbi:MAG: type II toxin-antitoxin system VapC family toxin [Acidobacteriota bacterium]